MRKLILPRAAGSGLIVPATSHALTRRGFLKIAGSVVGALAFGFPAIVRAAPRPFAFQHGVASGDPLPNRAIIWTRVGYSVVDVTAARVQMDWYYISERSDPLATQRSAAAWQVRTGTNQVAPAAGPLPSRV